MQKGVVMTWALGTILVIIISIVTVAAQSLIAERDMYKQRYNSIENNFNTLHKQYEDYAFSTEKRYAECTTLVRQLEDNNAILARHNSIITMRLNKLVLKVNKAKQLKSLKRKKNE